MGWLKVILAIPDIVRAIKALIDFVNEQQKKREHEKAVKLVEDVKNAKSEDDFRNVADRL